MTGPYTTDFYDALRTQSRRSAAVAVPLITRLVQPRSVVDIGCGTGTWLAAFRNLGIADVVGVDGAWVARQTLEIPPNRFHVRDVRRPLDLGRRFDLALSIEVAEHLPAASASDFIENLTRLAPRSGVFRSHPLPGRYGPQKRAVANVLGSPVSRATLRGDRLPARAPVG